MSSPRISVPLGAMMPGSVKLLVPRMVSAVVVLLSVLSEPFSVMTPDAVPS